MADRITTWRLGNLTACLFFHPGGPLPGELCTKRKRGIWVERYGADFRRQWIARSWKGAARQMTEWGYEPAGHLRVTR